MCLGLRRRDDPAARVLGRRPRNRSRTRRRSDEGVVMRWCGEGSLGELWRVAGLGSVRFGPLVASAKYADFEDLWAPLPTGIGPAGAFCKSLDEADRTALRDAFRQRLQIGDGPFELTARAWAVAGTVRS